MDVAKEKRVGLYTLGCKLNFSETSAISRDFQDNGYEIVNFNDPADVYVINTCSVTDNADKKCRKIINKALKTSPGAFIAIIGCYAQLQPEEIAEIPGVDLVLGAREKFNILDFLDNIDKKEKGEFHACAINEANYFRNAYSAGDRTRSFLKVQDGCDYGCAFCTIPLARGKSRSDSIENIVRSVQEIIDQDVKEIVLTGINIGDYGKGITGGKKKNYQFIDLIRELDKIEGVNRYRISSIEPNLLTDEIIDFVTASDKFMPHFHIPLQSGSDKILKKMRRRYLSELYRNRICRIKEKMPHAGVGVDVIVGFPGETNNDFMETYHFLKDLPVSYLHVFTYSERANTLAAEMKEQVPLHERRKRSKMLRQLSHKKKSAFYMEHEGRMREVLYETENKEGYMYGFTDNYIRVKSPYDLNMANEVIEIPLKAIDPREEVVFSPAQTVEI